MTIEKRCVNYVGLARVDGTYPAAWDEMRGLEASDCKNCFFNQGGGVRWSTVEYGFLRLVFCVGVWYNNSCLGVAVSDSTLGGARNADTWN